MIIDLLFQVMDSYVKSRMQLYIDSAVHRP